MANITSSEFRGKSLFITVDADPSAGAGTVAPVGTIAYTELLGNFKKVASADTSWLPLKILKNIATIVSSAVPSLDTNLSEGLNITALAVAITSFTTNLTGTPANFDKLLIRIKDNGTPQALSFGASFEGKGVTLPTTTVATKVMTIGLIYDSVTTKWGCVSVAVEDAAVGGGGSIFDISSARFSGQWYDAFMNYGVITGSVNYWNAAMSAMPFIVGEDHTVTAIRFEVTTGIASNNARIGIYTSTAAGYPGTLIEESGNIDCSTTGLKTYNLASALPLLSANRMYFIVFAAQINTLVFREQSTICLLPSSGANRGANYRLGAFSFGALTTPFPAGASINTGGLLVNLLKQ